MKILVTGDRGYIGSILVPILIKKNYEVLGFDIGYFEDCLLEECENSYTKIIKDIRDVSDLDFKIDSGDRIAQMVIAKHETVSWKSVDKLDDSLRGDKGFGSTGK